MTYEHRPERSVDQLIVRISQQCAERAPGIAPEELEAAIRSEFNRWSGAAVTDFVPIFVERTIRSRFIGTDL